jgi:hypothetical protein
VATNEAPSLLLEPTWIVQSSTKLTTLPAVEVEMHESEEPAGDQRKGIRLWAWSKI